jgi:hypothetical protein
MTFHQRGHVTVARSAQQIAFPVTGNASIHGHSQGRIVDAVSSSGYSCFSHPEICFGDQSKISLLATISCSLLWVASRQGLGRRADSQVC